ncbi:MAG: caspase family protein [Bacteroidetes bacterium]|nr:caspase family protein [Bacteroidota bacterium]
MKKLKYIPLFFLCLLLGSGKPPVPPVKRALIIAIGNYPATSGWSAINSNRDVPYMLQLFQSQGFLKENIAILQDSLATYTGIQQAVARLCELSKPGDIVAIHISAHGEQVEDDNGDEVDGLDESIVTWGAKSPRVSTNFQQDQAAYFRDDKFGELIDQLRAKLGSKGDVVVFMDACHSGSGTRGTMKVRGGQPAFTSGKPINKTSGTDTEGVFGEKAKPANGMATYIVFSAARAEELAAETTNDNNEGMGSLTYALSKVFENLDSNASYRSVFAGVQSVMHQKVRGQHPVLEGTGTERKLFGGNFVSQKPYAEIEAINGSREILIREGSFTGYEPGAIVLVCKAGTQDPSVTNTLDTGTVIQAGYYSALVKLKKGGIKSTTDAWVFLLNPVYNLRLTKVNVEHSKWGFTPAEAKAIRLRLSVMKGFAVADTSELILAKGKLKDTLKIAANGFPFQLMDKGLLEKEWSDACRRYSRYVFFSSLEVKDRKYNQDIRFIPVRNGKPDTLLLQKKMVNGTYEFQEKDSFVIQIKNSGTKPFYFNVLDLQPDGYINAIMPNRGQKVYARELQVLPGQTRLFNKAFVILSPPYGEEIFKFFFSPKPLDLELIASPPPGAIKRASLSFMEQLVDKSVQNTRGDAVTLQGSAEGAVGQVVFRILPKK